MPYFTSDPQQEVEYKELIQKVRQEIVLTLQAITGVKITPEDTAQGGLSVADGCRCLTKELDMIAC
ncbi:MAG: hypothetical protein PUH41_04315 [Prevotella sp.]|nr:hypothetical protein [Prevotella sp.]